MTSQRKTTNKEDQTIGKEKQLKKSTLKISKTTQNVE